MEPLFILFGLFFILVMTVLAFVVLGRLNGLERWTRGHEDRLNELEKKLRDQKSPAAMAETVKSDAAKPSPVPSPAVSAPPPLPKPTVSVPPIVIPVAPAAAAKINPTVSFVSTPSTARLSPPAPAQRTPPPSAQASPAAEKPKDPGAEITLGARWATRLGSGLLVITVVFIGVYISQHSAPAVRLLEVCALAAAVTGAGLWLERQAREFGEAVFASGLAIFYFAAFAAHAIAAMRVIAEANVEAGLAVQFLAVAAIAVIAWWRNRPHTALMAVALGMLSCFFALHRDRMEISLGAALGLAAAAAALRVARGWVWPLLAGYVGAQICYAGSILVLMGYTLPDFFRGEWVNVPLHPLMQEFDLWPGITLVFPTAYFLLLLGADLRAETRQRTENTTLRGGIVLMAAILYGLGGWWGGAEFGHSWDSHNLLAAAIICLGAGLVYQWRKDAAEIYEVLYAAAGTWAVIYLINEYTGYIRWLALLLECFIFAWRARRDGASFAWVCLYGAWACSFVMAFRDATHLSASIDAWSALRLKFALWPVVSLALWAWLEKAPREVRDDERTGGLIGAIMTAAGAVLLGVTAWANPATSWLFLGLAVGAAVFALLLKLRTPWFTVWAALLISMWSYAPFVNTSTLEIIFSLTAFTASTLALTALLQSRAGQKHKIIWANFGEVFALLSLLYVWIRGIDTLPNGPDHLSLILTLGALGLAALAWRGPWRTIGDLAWIWALAGLLAGWDRYDPVNSYAVNYACLALTLALGWLWGALGRKAKPGLYCLLPDHAGLVLPGFLFAGWVGECITKGTADSTAALIFAGSAVAFALVGRRQWLPGGGAAALLLSFAAFFRSLLLNLHQVNDSWTPALVAAAIIVEGWILARRTPPEQRSARNVVLFLVALAALLAFDWPVLSLPGAGSRYVTMLWAAAGAGVFIAGLAARLREYRYAGLLALAVCVPRMFLTDITDQLGRILAFGALAVVLLAIGFSYHKLRAWLVARDAVAPAIPPPIKPAA